MVVYKLDQRWEVGPRSTYIRCRVWQKILCSDEAHFDHLIIWSLNKVQLVQELKSIDHPMRFRYVKWDLQKMAILVKKIFSDKAHFDIGWYVNKLNCRIWGTENPHAYIEKPTHPKRVAVCCEFPSRFIIGQFFFENEQGAAVTVNGDCYWAMWNEFLFTKF